MGALAASSVLGARRWGAFEAELAQEAQIVREAPVVDDLPVGDPVRLERRDLGRVAGRFDPGVRPSVVGAAEAHAGPHFAPLGGQILDGDLRVGEGGVDERDDLLELVLVGWPTGPVVDVLGGVQVVNGVQVAAIPDVPVEPADQVLVRFLSLP